MTRAIARGASRWVALAIAAASSQTVCGTIWCQPLARAQPAPEQPQPEQPQPEQPQPEQPQPEQPQPQPQEAQPPTERAPGESPPGEPAAGQQPWEEPLAEEPPGAKPPPFRLEFYGFTMLDIGYEVRQNDPNWFDVVRPTKLPSFPDEFGEGGRTFASVRQTRFGVKGFTPTDLGELQTIFEWELFGVGVDAGQTTLRLRHAYGELGQLGAGQYWSPFMDIDVFPNSLEYWGPPGMVFFRNVQVRWMPIKGDTRLTFALERPGATADASEVNREFIEAAGVKGHFPYPDLSGEFRYGGPWGYVELAGIVRRIEWNTPDPPAAVDISDGVFGWGFQLSSNVKLLADNVLKLSAVYGHGIQNYMNDASADIGVEENPGNLDQPIEGVAMPVFGLVAFVDWYWTKKWSSSAGYSLVWIDNASGQDPSDLEWGHYALGNLLYKPVEDFMVGGELQFARRQNWADDFDVNDYRIQFSFKWNFAATLARTAGSAK
jgi:hypothetical protein